MDASPWLVLERGVAAVGQYGVDLGLKLLLDTRVIGHVMEHPREGGGGGLVAGEEQIHTQQS